MSPSLKKEINQPVKQDRAIAKVIQQRRQQLQELSPEERTLSIMRSALRVAREKRKHDAQIISQKLEARKQVAYEARIRKSPLVEEAVQEAKGRDMLVKETLVNRHGQELIIERPYVKDREPYQKRPTTRAIKKHQQKQSGEFVGGVMDQAEPNEALKRMRKALKQARVKRKTDLVSARLDVEHERSMMWGVRRGPDRLNKAIEAPRRGRCSQRPSCRR